MHITQKSEGSQCLPVGERLQGVGSMIYQLSTTQKEVGITILIF